MKAPKINPVSTVPLQKPKFYRLENGAGLYDLRLGNQEILKIEWLFDAGRFYEIKPLASRIAAQQLKSGVEGYNADKLADFFDFYGAKLKIYDDFDNTCVRLYCLTKHLPTLLPLLYEILLHPIYDAKELEQFCSRNKQTLKLELQKNDVLAYRCFTELLFGEKHPYGYNSIPEFYDAINRDDLFEHHQRCYHAGGCKVIVSGKTNDSIIDLIRQFTLKLPTGKTAAEIKVPEFPNNVPLQFVHPAAKESAQASIRIGCRMFDKKHPDYHAFSFVNSLLGGYFGARLMQNLREDKGYTYSIYSSMETMQKGGYFYIYTDVNTDVKDAALAEIYHELERLQHEPVPEEELNMLKNYSLGMFLNSVDGVFNVSSVIRELIEEDIPYDFFEDAVEKTKAIAAEEVMEIAQKYFKRENLCEVLVY
jgi:predicted Zn-dependent peptidase